MIYLKTDDEIALMRESNTLVGKTLGELARWIAPGITTLRLDQIAEQYIRDNGGVPGFKGYGGFPFTLCISVNENIVHGFPSSYVLRDGDIVSIDVGAFKDGFHGDCAATFICGEVSEEARRLIEVTKQSFFEGLKYAREGYRLPDLSGAIQRYVEEHGFSVVREYVGHGIGANLHEAPEVPNFVSPRMGRPRLLRGMTIAVEPMVNAGKAAIKVMPDGWTVKTADGKLSAHYENTILITDGEPELLTDPDTKAE